MMNDVFDLFSKHCDNIQKLSGGQFIAICPFHNESKRSFSFNEDGLYNCKACGESGNAITFAKAFDENPKPFYSSDFLLNRQRTGGKQTGNADKQQDNSVKSTGKSLTTEQLWDKIHNEYHTEWFDSFSRNINCVGMYKGHLTFPYFDVDGKKPIAIKHHKSYPYWEGDGSNKFYMEWHIPYFDKSKPLIIVEGEVDTLTMLDAKYNAVSGSAGAIAVPTIPDSFKDFPEIIILYDNDKAGIKGSNKMADTIYKSLGVLPSIGEWRDGLPDKFDCSDDKEANNEA